MSTFIRRFLSDPGEEVLLEIESVNILDLDPPASITGVGAGTVLIVGEFENGPFETVYEVSGATDLAATFGTLGYDYAGVVGNNPCARSRTADNAATAEKWNGNGFVQLSGKKFRRLLVCRVDTSVGSVEFRREAFLVGNGGGFFDLESGQILGLKLNGASEDTATFTGVAAVVTGVGGTYPTTFAGGETLTIGYDDAADFTVTFLDADESNAQVAARINTYAGFTFASVSGGQLRLTGVKKGTDGEVRVVAGSTGVLTKLGLTAATTAGTGNVGNIDSVTSAEVKTIVEADIAGTRVDVQADGKLRISQPYVTATDTLEVGTSTTADALGFVIGTTAGNATGTAGKIPAGTELTNAGATNTFVTMQDVDITADSPGPYTVKVRHALDDGTGAVANAATIVVVNTTIPLGGFSVTNPAQLAAALTESQIDAMYAVAIEATNDLNSIARETNIIYSARQSNRVRKALRTNALEASAEGCFGRMAFVRPPLNTTKATAKSSSAEPGVGAYRDQRVAYCYPGINTYVPLIARRGLGGGDGFTVDGNVDVGADGFLASVCSQLPPEENPGQETTFTSQANGLESGANAQGFKMSDYTAFKRAGICAPRMDSGKLIFQSGVTSVDPSVYPNLVNIARRRMADFIQDTLARRGKGYGKKLSTFARRKALAGEMQMWLGGLLSKNKPENQRIAGYTVDAKSGNTKVSLGKGLYRIIIKVRTLASLDSIVLETTIGEQVAVEEQFEEAA